MSEPEIRGAAGAIDRVVDEVAAAVRFLTIVPVPGTVSAAFGAGAFPVVGFGLGLSGVALDGLLGAAAAPGLRAALVLALWVALSRALHEDALADTFDGFGGHDVEERLRILADASTGAFGVVAVVFSLALRIAALAAVGEGMRAAAILVAPVAGRAVMTLAARGARPAKATGLGAAFVASVTSAQAATAGALALVASVVFAGPFGLVAAGSAAAIGLGFRSFCAGRFGGVTGDVLGASGAVAETTALVVFALGGGR